MDQGTQMREALGHQWGDQAYALGAWSGRLNTRRTLIDGPKESWKPNLKVIKAVIHFATTTGRINTDPWVSQTPHNPTEALSQTTFVKSRIRGHQGSSPTPIFQAVKHMAKGMEAMAHEMTLMKEENHNLRKANEALSKRRRAKKTRVRQGGALTIEDAHDNLAQKEVNEQVVQDMRENWGGDGERLATIRRCGNYGKPGHNARTCQIEAEMTSVYSSE
ncbi:hypothetical protein V502_00396 [Pseudogymnoascus sp. VKM F-4520 (FW-2644)]|nr:hypothetical protein V502_00396 [Pseudogymnoascus sp. VKM F-4520 (FW-2644)]